MVATWCCFISTQFLAGSMPSEDHQAERISAVAITKLAAS
jgi:hypothetical protein